MKKLILFVAAFLSLSLSSASLAADEHAHEKKKEPVIKSEVKEVQGELVYLGKNFISLVYERDANTGAEKEIRIDLDPGNVTLEHLRSLQQLNTGDTIYVQYIDETRDYGNTKKNTIRAAVIRFISPVSVNSIYKKKDKQPSEEESLSLKGVKSDE